MAVEKTHLVTLTGPQELLDQALGQCIAGGNFQPEAAGNHIASLRNYAKPEDTNPYKALLERLQTAAAGAGKTPVPLESEIPLSLEDCTKALEQLEQDFSKLEEEHATLTKELNYCEACATQLEHFTTMDIPLRDLFDCEFVDIRFGRLPIENHAAALGYTQRAKTALFISFSTDEEYCWGMYLTPTAYTDGVDLAFASLFFERLHVPDAASTPAQAMELLKEQLEPDMKRLREIEATLAGYWEQNNRLYDRVYTYLKEQSHLCDIRKYAALNGPRFILLGWVPKGELEGFQKQFEAMEGIELSVGSRDLPETLTPPVRLKNRWFARPFEFYTKMFGMPTWGEIDPTPFVAITYTLLYGIMFADVGQGLLLALIGYFFMYKKKGMALGKLLLPCGLSGAFFGLIFGSVFGYEHLLDPMYKAIGFGEKPIEIMDSENILTILFGAVGIGVALMVVALIISIYSALKRKNLGKALFSENGVVGLIFYLSAIVFALNLLLGLNIPNIIPLLGLLVPLACLWIKEPLEKLANREKEWQPEGWGGALTQGFFELFEAVLSYVTNTVSFLRVGAFVLVHAGMMMVFMSLAEMAGGVVGIILVIFGNLFVLALEGLLVGVQSLRLEFYEMFNRFFEGAGREFSPLV